MPDKTPEQRIWVLEQDSKTVNDKLGVIIRLLEGTDSRTGIKETLADVQREVRRISKLSEQLETLEEKAVRKEEFKQMELRLKVLEDQRTVNQGVQLGRRGLWLVISSAVGFIAVVVGLLLSIQNLVSRVAL